MSLGIHCALKWIGKQRQSAQWLEYHIDFSSWRVAGLEMVTEIQPELQGKKSLDWGEGWVIDTMIKWILL